MKIFSYFAKRVNDKLVRYDFFQMVQETGCSNIIQEVMQGPPDGFVVVLAKPYNEQIPDLHKLVEGEPVLGEDGNYYESWTTGLYSFEELDRMLADERLSVNERINLGRERANFHFFPFRGKRIACDRLSRSDIDGTSMYIAQFGSFPEDWVGGWKAMDNSYVSLATLEDWKEFIKAIFDQGQINFKHAQALKEIMRTTRDLKVMSSLGWNTPTGFAATPLPEIHDTVSIA